MPAQKRSSSENLEEEEDEEKVVEVKDEEEEEEVEQQEQQDEEVVEAEAEAEAAGEEAGGDGDVDDVDEDDDDEDEEEEEDEDDDEDDSNGSRSSKTGKNDEYVTVNLADIRKEVQCPICLGIIRKTRTVMECLHRFCRECIDKSMRMGNNECPACRTHCASRRSLRDDPNYDALIAALYQDIDKYEAEELAFREEEKNRNKQIQASIAQTFQRQTEALGRKRTTAKNGAALPRRSRGRRKGRKNSRVAEPQGSDDDEYINGNEGGRDSSSADERVADFKPKRFKRWSGQRFSQSSAVDADGGDGNDDMEVCRESTVASSGLLASPEVLAWGRGGVRSHTRYGSVSGNGKSVRNRMAKLVDHLKNSEDNFDKLDVHLIVIPLDKQSIPSLEEPFLCCKSTTSVGHLCQFVALQTPHQAEEIELLVVKEPKVNPLASDPVPMIDLTKDKLQLVADQDSLGGLLANCNFDGSHMVLAYRRKASS